MLRLAVALYLMIVTAVGPAACCCTATRPTSRPGDQPPAPQSTPHSCCHHGHKGPPPARAPARPSSQAPPTPPACPCKQTSGSGIAGLAAADEAQEVSLRVALGDLFIQVPGLWAPPAPASATPASSQPVASGPSVTTDDLLY